MDTGYLNPRNHRQFSGSNPSAEKFLLSDRSGVLFENTNKPYYCETVVENPYKSRDDALHESRIGIDGSPHLLNAASQRTVSKPDQTTSPLAGSISPGFSSYSPESCSKKVPNQICENLDQSIRGFLFDSQTKPEPTSPTSPLDEKFMNDDKSTTEGFSPGCTDLFESRISFKGEDIFNSTIAVGPDQEFIRLSKEIWSLLEEKPEFGTYKWYTIEQFKYLLKSLFGNLETFRQFHLIFKDARRLKLEDCYGFDEIKRLLLKEMPQQARIEFSYAQIKKRILENKGSGEPLDTEDYLMKYLKFLDVYCGYLKEEQNNPSDWSMVEKYHLFEAEILSQQGIIDKRGYYDCIDRLCTIIYSIQRENKLELSIEMNPTGGLKSGVLYEGDSHPSDNLYFHFLLPEIKSLELELGKDEPYVLLLRNICHFYSIGCSSKYGDNDPRHIYAKQFYHFLKVLHHPFNKHELRDTFRQKRDHLDEFITYSMEAEEGLKKHKLMKYSLMGDEEIEYKSLCRSLRDIINKSDDFMTDFGKMNETLRESFQRVLESMEVIEQVFYDPQEEPLLKSKFIEALVKIIRKAGLADVNNTSAYSEQLFNAFCK